MKFVTPLQRWSYDRREKRFFLYGKAEGQVAHCPNTGSMKTLLEYATHLWVSDVGPDTKRKLRFTAELMELQDGTLALVNTGHANILGGEALQSGLIEGTQGLTNLQHEVKYSPETRFDWAFTNAHGQRVWVEVKNVTQAYGAEASFPDAVTTRGTKHLETLTEIVQQGGQALQIYIVARTGCTSFRPAEAIDPTYAQALRKAIKAGVQVVALGCEMSSTELSICKILPVVV